MKETGILYYMLLANLLLTFLFMVDTNGRYPLVEVAGSSGQKLSGELILRRLIILVSLPPFLWFSLEYSQSQRVGSMSGISDNNRDHGCSVWCESFISPILF